MKRWSLFLFVLLLVCPIAISSDLDTSRIVVNGTATIQVAPNQMIWVLSVRNLNPTSTGVAGIHAATVESVLAFLKNNQIEQGTIKTSGMMLSDNSRTVYNQASRYNETIQDGYIASTQIQFTLADFSKYSSIWMGLSAIQGVRVSNVYLDTTDRIKFQNEARTKAVLAARDKAEAIAKTLGVQISRPLIVEEDLSISEGYRRMMSESPSVITASNITLEGSSSAGNDQSIAPGSIAIRSRVKATFGFGKK